ncbi:MAG: AAA family ATPase [Sulfuricellaceae bacterium]|jgi:cytidylate kinase
MTSALSSLKTINTLAFLRSLVEASHPLDDRPRPPKPLVALSRDHGAGGEEVAEILSQRLGVGCYDKTLLDAIASSAGTDPYLMGELDEKVAHLRDAWVMSLLTNQPVLNEHFRNHLVNVVLGLVGTGGVIVGRGAHLILAGKPMLRLRIAGSPEACARRIAETDNIPISEALKQVQRINHERAHFVWEHFHSRLNDPTQFDLAVNTDHIPPAQAAELALSAMAARGLSVPLSPR